MFFSLFLSAWYLFVTFLLCHHPAHWITPWVSQLWGKAHTSYQKYFITYHISWVFFFFFCLTGLHVSPQTFLHIQVSGRNGRECEGGVRKESKCMNSVSHIWVLTFCVWIRRTKWLEVCPTMETHPGMKEDSGATHKMKQSSLTRCYWVAGKLLFNLFSVWLFIRSLNVKITDRMSYICIIF